MGAGPAAATAVRLPPSRRPRHHRPQVRRGEARPVQLTGFIGWLFWSAVHIYFLIGLRNRFVVALNWLWSYVTYQRGARLIGTEPRSTSA